MSGLSHTPGKRAWGNTHRGFESRPLRQFPNESTSGNCSTPHRTRLRFHACRHRRHGRPGITLPAIEDLSQGLRPRHRRYAMGEDVLFDCRLRP